MAESFVIQEVNKLNLKDGEYIVVAGGILDALGIRVTKDVDLVVTDEVYERLKNEGWEEIERNYGEKKKTVLVRGVYEIDTFWIDGSGKLSLEKLLKESQLVGGVTFVNLGMLLRWKKWANREKDQRDIKLIEQFLEENQ